ncbi:MAG TPA: InlB B-repeat-containing protein [Eubacteriales bacterium]|nr:InlB B-repeat-containing protein [Eubacteriales bacterium]
MKKAKLTRVACVLCLVIAACLPLTACSQSGQSADPGAWGYECKVIYNALGGKVNAREVRTTYYLPNSYVFEPSGSSNMLVEPVRDGYILAGWYTAKTDEPTESGEDYTFSASDRWDFYLDRVQDDMTLYARWLPRGKVEYVNADTGEVLFSKNITEDSPVQELSEAVVDFRKPEGTTLFGYYSNPECTEEYDFSSYVHSEPHPSEAQIYAALYEEFPQYLEQVEYVEPEEDETKATDDTSYLFLNKLGYQLTTTDEQALAELREAKDRLVEESIQNYLTNTAGKVVYMKFVDGNIVRVNSVGDLKIAGEYGFFGTDAQGNTIDGYVIESDVDFSGITLSMAESFSGVIYGNGHTLSNVTLSVSSKKVDTDTEKQLALIGAISDAEISDLTFKDAKISIQVKEGIAVNAALLALSADNVKLTNCHIDGLTIDSGKGDTGAAKYSLGDLFVTEKNIELTGCAGEGLVANVLNPAKLKLTILELPQEEETTQDGTVTAEP